MIKIKVGDEVVVIAGRSKGLRGKVLEVLRLGKKMNAKCGSKTKKSDTLKVIVEGASLVTKHVKSNPQLNEPGGIKQVESAIDISNVLLYNPTAQKPDRVGFKFLEDGTKVRYFKSDGEVVGV